jgi:hypothetical protein
MESLYGKVNRVRNEKLASHEKMTRTHPQVFLGGLHSPQHLQGDLLLPKPDALIYVVSARPSDRQSDLFAFSAQGA